MSFFGESYILKCASHTRHGPSTSHLSRVRQLACVIHYIHSLQMGRQNSGFCHTKCACHAQAGTEQTDLDRLRGGVIREMTWKRELLMADGGKNSL